MGSNELEPGGAVERPRFAGAWVITDYTGKWYDCDRIC